MQMYDHSARLDRDTALMLWTQGSAWFSSEQNQKGQIKVGQLADLAVLSKDYFRVPEEEIKGIESVLTVVNGDIVYAAGSFGPLAPPAIPVLPEWSPVVKVPGHYRSAPPQAARVGMSAVHHCSGPCGVHSHQHDFARTSEMPVSDDNAFWGRWAAAALHSDEKHLCSAPGRPGAVLPAPDRQPAAAVRARPAEGAALQRRADAH
jgi:hypothetical protein